ncbi:MAG TPA: prolipoprotein diacylglyceryl transferase [Lentisphaeria bacterium]|nr:MAG: prolipoprotein diacylglyceryl transferase [Lentisphaerae bacterium GWF2_38_69]HBM15743.1 prolipoprotein diacylglyceryl transferase [Lentisphaeria bacterium]
MLHYPNINPVALKFGSIKIYWYGIMYLLGFLASWFLGIKRSKRINGLWEKDDISDLIFYAMAGVLIGGRIGYIVFYNFPYYISNPFEIFRVWEGGMSFHGATIGVVITFILYAKKKGKNLFQVGDLILPTVPIGLALGRLGNFINGELWGKASNLPWAMIFPADPSQLPRHPSELYELILEGIILFIVLWIYSSKERPRMAVSGMFLALYGIFRFIVEFVRLPDPQLGYIAFGWLTMGQILSIPMIIIGLFFIYWGYTRHPLIRGLNKDDIDFLARNKEKERKNTDKGNKKDRN